MESGFFWEVGETLRWKDAFYSLSGAINRPRQTPGKILGEFVVYYKKIPKSQKVWKQIFDQKLGRNTNISSAKRSPTRQKSH